MSEFPVDPRSIRTRNLIIVPSALQVYTPLAMHLLNVTTKRLELFYGKNTPRYAILSHMWGKEQDEVLFKNIEGSDDDRRDGEKRKGYAKILAACEQAIRDGWEYIWIDTCCIDKQSSAELSEAINSMYTWYQGSEVCYAYLEDVQAIKESQVDGNTTFEIVRFEESRWFKRGWTLQELIAPRRVVFYSREWIDIGTKVTLRDVISAMTDIRVEMITSYDSDKASVAEKMSWASKRETKRDEDIAYCLLGLLGVNMPLLYGEGTRAFRRLQEEVMKVSDDHSIFAWRTAHINCYGDRLKAIKGTRGMLADSPSNFLGAGTVVRSKDESLYPAYSMSNKGLQIGLPIQPVNPEELIGINSADGQNVFKAILDCTYRDTTPTRWVVIYLKMVGKDRYMRIFPYWLDDIEMNPNMAVTDGWVVTSLIVLQIANHTGAGWPERINLKILPTESKYNYEGSNIGEHQDLYVDVCIWHSHAYAFFFSCKGKHFGVVTGYDAGETPWMDIILEDDYKGSSLISLPVGEHDFPGPIDRLYQEGGSRYHVVRQNLNFLCLNISKDHLVDVSLKSLSGHTYEITVDIRRTIILVPLQISFNDGFLDGLYPHNVHPNTKKEGVDWFAAFNSKVKRVLDVSPVHRFEDEAYSKIVFSPDGKHLATTAGKRVQIYNIISGVKTCHGVLGDKSFDISCMCFSPDGNFLAIGTGDGLIFLWDITKNYIHHHSTGHQHDINVLRFTPDSRLVISVSGHARMVRILDLVNGTSEDVCNLGHEELYSVAISPNNRLVATAYDAVIQIWDLETKEIVEELQGHNGNVGYITFTPDGKGLVSGSDDKTLKHWHIGGLTATTEERSNNIKHVNNPNIPCVPASRDVDRSSRCVLMDIKYKDSISSAAVSYDGKWIISGSGGNIQFRDSRDGTVQFMFWERFNYVFSLSISSVSNIFTTRCGDEIQIWKFDNVEAMDKSY